MHSRSPAADRDGGPRPTVLISGAGSGIGLASAVFLAERGFRVVATVPDLAQQTAIETLATTRGVSLQVRPLDVTDAASIRRTVDGVVQERRPIDAVIHSAGLGLRGFFEDLSETRERRQGSGCAPHMAPVTRASAGVDADDRTFLYDCCECCEPIVRHSVAFR